MVADIQKHLNDDNTWGTNHKIMFYIYFEAYEKAKTKYINEFLKIYIKELIEKTTLKFFNGYIKNTKDNPVASENKKEFKKEFLNYNKIFLNKETKEDIKKEIFEVITYFLKCNEVRVVRKIIEKTNEEKLLNVFDKRKIKEIINKNTKSNFDRMELLNKLTTLKIGKKVIF